MYRIFRLRLTVCAYLLIFHRTTTTRWGNVLQQTTENICIIIFFLFLALAADVIFTSIALGGAVANHALHTYMYVVICIHISTLLYNTMCAHATSLRPNHTFWHFGDTTPYIIAHLSYFRYKSPTSPVAVIS